MLATLPDDLVLAVARCTATASARAGLVQTCKNWRDAIGDNDELWRLIAMNRFPRLRILASKLTFGGTWKARYQAQLAAEKPHVAPTLADFVLTIEITWPSGELFHAWSGTCTGAEGWNFEYDFVCHDLWTNESWPACLPRPKPDIDHDQLLTWFKENAADELRLSLYVSRVSGGALQTVCLMRQKKTHDFERDNYEAVKWIAIAEDVPHRLRDFPEVELDQHDVMLRGAYFFPTLVLSTGIFQWCFRAHNDVDLNEEELLRYFSIFVPWP